MPEKRLNAAQHSPKRFLFYMGHPAHYHNFKNPIAALLGLGHSVKVVARGKDVLFDLLSEEEWDISFLAARKKKGRGDMVRGILKREIVMLKLVRKFRPHLMIGTDLVITHVGKITNIPTLVVNEDDSAAVPLMAKYAFPYATAILAPNCCDQSPGNHKKIGYEGYHELAYLHPNLFSPSREKLPEKLKASKRYFVLRFASLHAHHDKGKQGIDDELAITLVNGLKQYGDIFITSERPLHPELEPFRHPVKPSKMHQVLAHASLYIGDSQTMAAEAAVLGIPSIRFNDFVGKLSYLEELEHKYGLTTGIPTHQPDDLYGLAMALAKSPAATKTWQKKRADMLENTVDVTPYWVSVFLDIALPGERTVVSMKTIT